MGQESDRVKEVLQRMLDGMVDKDAELMRDTMSEDMMLIHMTGRRQSREEFIADVLNGTLNYRSSEIVDAPVAINGDRAEVKLRTRTLAAVYGGGYHTWNLSLDTELRIEDGRWMVVRSSAGTFRGGMAVSS